MKTFFKFGQLKQDNQAALHFERWQPADQPVELRPVAGDPLPAIDLDGLICFRFERDGAAVLVSVKPLYIPAYEQDEPDGPIIISRDVEWQTDRFGYPAFISRTMEL